jgi:hypothetical protein
MKQHTYSYPVELNGASGSGYTDKVFEDSYLYGIRAKGVTPGSGTLTIKKEAVGAQPATTIYTSAVATTGLDDAPYKLVQDATGADISGEYNQTVVRRGERLQAVGTVLGAAGTLYVDVLLSNMPLPVTR